MGLYVQTYCVGIYSIKIKTKETQKSLEKVIYTVTLSLLCNSNHFRPWNNM